VVDVADGADVHVGLAAYEFLFRHDGLRKLSLLEGEASVESWGAD